MKFKVRLTELEKQNSDKEVLKEWIADGLGALIKLGSGSSMLRNAGRFFKAVPLSSKEVGLLLL